MTYYQLVCAWERGHSIEVPGGFPPRTLPILEESAAWKRWELQTDGDQVWLLTPADADGFRDYAEMWERVK